MVRRRRSPARRRSGGKTQFSIFNGIAAVNGLFAFEIPQALGDVYDGFQAGSVQQGFTNAGNRVMNNFTFSNVFRTAAPVSLIGGMKKLGILPACRITKRVRFF